LCLNYIQNGHCLVDGEPCLLGLHGSEARNEHRECVRHGPFDVWRTQEDSILVSDLGGPLGGVKDCYALGVSLEEARKTAQTISRNTGAKIVTTERTCGKCGAGFWPRADSVKCDTLSRLTGYFCSSCARFSDEAELDERLREVDEAQDMGHIDLSAWCG